MTSSCLLILYFAAKVHIISEVTNIFQEKMRILLKKVNDPSVFVRKRGVLYMYSNRLMNPVMLKTLRTSLFSPLM